MEARGAAGEDFVYGNPILFVRDVPVAGVAAERVAVRLGELPLNDLPPATLARMLERAGLRWKVIVVSACYSGGFVDPLREIREDVDARPAIMI